MSSLIPLTPMQEMMFAAALSDNSRYVTSLLFQIKCKPFASLRERFALLVSRHEILRTHLTIKDGQPFMTVKDSPSAEITEAAELPQENFSIDPVGDEKLIKIYICEDEMLFVFSHILLDGWSVALLVNELLSDSEPSGKASPFRYFCKWINTRKSADNVLKIADETEQASLPFEEKNNIYKRETLSFELENSERAVKTAAALGVPLGRFIEAIWGALCARYGGGETFVAAVDSGRFAPVPGITSIAGMLVSTIAVPVKIGAEQTFSNFVREFSDNAAAIIKQGFVPTAKKLKSIISVEPVGISQNENFTLLRSNAKLITDFDFVVVLDDKISCRFEYSGYSQSAITAIRDHFIKFSETVTTNPDSVINDIDFLSSNEKDFINRRNSDSELLLQSEIPITRKFSLTAAKNSEKTAVFHSGKSYSYTQIDDLSNRLAQFLINKKISGGVIINLPRSADFVIAEIGVMKAGCYFIPTDPAAPKNRFIKICETVKPAFVIDSENYENCFFETAANLPEISPEMTAYVIMTSGTTGEPKGVLVSHKAIAHYLAWAAKTYKTDENTVSALIYGFTFDGAFGSIYSPLLSGGTLHIVGGETRFDIPKIADYCISNTVTYFDLPAALLTDFTKFLSEKNCKNALRVIITGGEQVKPFYDCGIAVSNEYGPTECTVAVTQAFLKPGEKITIGNPLPNTSVYVLDSNKKPCPLGIFGEAYIGGIQLADGYIGVDNSAFCDNPFGSGKLYKTGDIVRFTETENGFALEFFGRNDGQVKLNGFRIETGEIETAARECGAENAVAVLENGSIMLFAVCDNPEEINKKMRSVMPHYMIPTVISVPEIPLKESGKPDFVKLSAYNKKRETAPENYSPECEKLCEMFFVITGKKALGRDNFIYCGGNSITAMKMSFALAEKGVALSAADIIASENFAKLSLKMSVSENIFHKNSDSFTPPNVLKSMIYLAAKDGEASYTVTSSRPCGADFTELSKRIEKAAKLHDILRCRFFINDDNSFAAKIGENPNIKLLSEDEPLPETIDPLGEFLVFAKPGDGVLTLRYHHIVLDGFAVDLLFSELTGGVFPDSAQSYADFINSLSQKSEAYYEETLKNALPVRLFDIQNSPEKLSYTRFYEEHYREKIENAAKKIGVTPAVFLMTAFGVFLSAFGDTKNTYIPAIASFRKTGGLLGCAAQTFPMYFSAEGSFSDAAIRLRESLSETVSYVNIPERFCELPYIFTDEEATGKFSGNQHYGLIIKSGGDILYDEKSVSPELIETLKTRLFAAIENGIENEISVFCAGEEKRITQHFSRGKPCDNTFDYEANLRSEKSLEIAQALKNSGIGAGDIVMIEEDRENSAINSYAGVTLSGAAFLPIDASLPEARKAEIAADCKPAAKIKNGEVTFFSNSEKYPENTAYVIYTSGSTGKPKGVLMSKNALKSQINSTIEHFGFTKEDVFLHYINFSFDPSVWVIYSAFAAGSKTEVVPEAVRHLPDKIAEFISEKGVTIAVLPAAAAYDIINALGENRLRMIFIGGDRFQIPKRTIFTKNIDIYNLYGPTETCINASFYKLPKDCEKTSNIGKPIAGTDIYILDKEKRPSPVGIRGEIYIGGDKLSNGYINRPTETGNAFSDVAPFGRLYKTGDRAFWNADGTIEFIGRTDRQVKIRSFRVELSEIESAISAITNSFCAAVYESGILSAFTVSEMGEADIKKRLRETLPSYMIPNRIITADKLPVTANGKIDYKKLAVPQSETAVLPLTDTEKLIAAAFESALSLKPETVRKTDDFYALGGHSLKLFALSGILAAKGLHIGINDILENPVVCDLAKIADKSAETSKTGGNLAFSESSYTEYVKKCESIPLYPKRNPDNIMITGATGFLGAHILRECLSKTSAVITLPVRGEASRIKETLDYYFPGEIFDLSRLRIINADISKETFETDGNIDIIYHSAADIRHYAPFDEAYRANVTATENIIRLTKEKNAYLAHISTASAVNRPVITENDHELGSDFENVYQKTKQTAERIILADKDLDYGVFRVGNITPSLCFGKKAKSADTNAYLRLLTLLVKSKTLPDFRGRSGYCFADKTAEAITLLAGVKTLNRQIFHITNPNILTFSNIFDMIGIAPDGDREKIPDELRGIYAQRAVEKHTDITSEIRNDGTVTLLSRFGFEWSAPDRDYMKAFIGYEKLFQRA
jgi:amino acid adenylation domain-containing protein